jgi:hypothetical protein
VKWSFADAVADIGSQLAPRPVQGGPVMEGERNKKCRLVAADVAVAWLERNHFAASVANATVAGQSPWVHSDRTAGPCEVVAVVAAEDAVAAACKRHWWTRRAPSRVRAADASAVQRWPTRNDYGRVWEGVEGARKMWEPHLLSVEEQDFAVAEPIGHDVQRTWCMVLMWAPVEPFENATVADGKLVVEQAYGSRLLLAQSRLFELP